MKKKRKWLRSKKHTGWKKDQKEKTRRRKLLDSTPKNQTLRNRRLLAARRAQALANVTKDSETRRKAQADADYFFNLVK